MIGGSDEIIAVKNPIAALRACVQIIDWWWPDAVFEDADTSARYGASHEVPLGKTRELFAYKDALAAEAWDDSGAVPQTANTMVDFLRGPRQLTVVVDNPDDAVMAAMLKAFREAGRSQVFNRGSKRVAV
jgi:hypothetical protein